MDNQTYKYSCPCSFFLLSPGHQLLVSHFSLELFHTFLSLAGTLSWEAGCSPALPRPASEPAPIHDVFEDTVQKKIM